jgi:osmoprotectant transport system permease protein
VLGGAGVLQTIPSLALLAFLIPIVGIGVVPATLALFLYALLPIVQGTCTGITGIPTTLAASAEALGLTPSAKLLRIDLPLASPSILAGVRTSAVIAVGTATIAALVGAGGLGDPILEGIALRNTLLILAGAVPCAVLAVAVQALFVLLERVLVPRGLRIRTHSE